MNPVPAVFVAYKSRFPWWVDQLLLQLDWFWFAALLAWGLALVLWWRHPRRKKLPDSAWGWLPWSAGAGFVTALFEFAQINLESPPQPRTVTDFAFSALPMLAAAGWWWQSRPTRSRAWHVVGATLAAALVAIAFWRFRAPMSGGWPVVAAAFLAVWPWWRKRDANAWSRVAVFLAALTPLFSMVGPLAVSARLYQPLLPQNAAALGAGAFQAIAAVIALAGLARDAWRALGAEAQRESWREIRPYLLVGGVWTVVCLTLATTQSNHTRRSGLMYVFEQMRRMSVQLDQRLVAEALGPQFQLDPASLPSLDDESPVLTARAPYLATGIGTPLARVLANVAQSPRGGLRAVSLLTIRDGWLVVALSSATPEQNGRVRLIHPAHELIRDAWERKADLVEPVVSSGAGTSEFLRMPLVAQDGAMLGWLEFAQARYGMAAMRTRAAPFLANALGLLVAWLFYAQSRNIREREAARRAAAVADESARVKSEFLAKVSHELRTPLQSVLGYGDLLAADVSDDVGRTRLAALRQNGEFMLRLVNDLLDLTAMEAGGFRFIEKPVALAALVRETTESLRPRAAAKGLTIACTLAPDFPPWVLIDGERFRQIVLNLAGNAVKFTERGGLELQLAVVERRADGACRIELAVRDTGPGIAPAEQARLFQPFSRLDPTMRHEGTGLGLALAAALCRATGGGLSVESDGHSGSCFRAHVIARPCAPPAAVPLAAPFANLHGRRILIVDDNALVRDLFAAWLAELGAVCDLAVDGADALACGERAVFDAVVLDLAMPKLDGLAVARRWRAEGRTWRIVGVSAHASGGDRTQALAAGMDAFLTKPVEQAALVAALAASGKPAANRHARLRAELVSRFRASASSEAAAVRDALTRRDWPGLKSRAHHLKSSAGVVGDERLYAACTALEDAADATDEIAADAAWSECQAALAPWLKGA